MARLLASLAVLVVPLSAQAPRLGFTPQVSWEISEAEPSQIRVADFNRDGKHDLAVTTELGAMNILLGNGAGSFKDKVDFKPGGRCNGFDCADFNGDGLLDLAIVHGSSLSTINGASFWLANGKGGYVRSGFVGGGKFGIGAAAGDFNGDRKADIAVLYNVAGGLRVHFGQGNGRFTGGTAVSSSLRGMNVEAGDLNRDGNLDLVASHYSGVSIYHGTGKGGFVYKGGVATNRICSGIDLGDVNRDGILDLAQVEYYASKVHVSLGLPAGGFKPTAALAVSFRCYDVKIADMNGDGFGDVCASDYGGGGQVRVFVGKGDGTFWPDQRFATGKQAVRVEAADFDRDGLADLAAPYRNYGQTAYVSVLLNRTATGPWILAGPGLRSATGLPLFQGTGTLRAKTRASMNLTRARPSAPALFVGGSMRLDLPLLGGILVPSLDLFSQTLAVDGSGKASLSLTVPPGIPRGTRFFSQAWILDASGPVGLAASNGLRGLTQ